MFPVDIQTERLRLRELTREEVGAAHVWGSDPEVVRFMQWGPNDLVDTVRHMESTIVAARHQPRVDYTFGIEERLERVHAVCEVGNLASANVLDKLMTHEGVLRRHMHVKGRWRDSHAYGVMRAEWDAPTRCIQER